ncbi:MAG: STAS domain-containing protein [Candidatus Sumerlaeia bacterium]|nr:STAS domain-containing protein [Candidatus Sumerlaeia bacterium]
MPVECHLSGSEARIVYRNRLGARDLYRPRAEVKRALTHKVRRVVLDMRGVTALDSDALLQILASHIAAVKAGAKLVVINASEDLVALMKRAAVGNIVTFEGADQG